MVKTLVRNKIRKLRFHAGEMTQQALAEQVGVTRQTVVAIEGGKYSPSLEVAFRIAEVFRVPLEEVFQYGQYNRSQSLAAEAPEPDPSDSEGSLPRKGSLP